MKKKQASNLVVLYRKNKQKSQPTQSKWIPFCTSHPIKCRADDLPPLNDREHIYIIPCYPYFIVKKKKNLDYDYIQIKISTHIVHSHVILIFCRVYIIYIFEIYTQYTPCIIYLLFCHFNNELNIHLYRNNSTPYAQHYCYYYSRIIIIFNIY